jgi:hypothetical protein
VFLPGSEDVSVSQDIELDVFIITISGSLVLLSRPTRPR